MYSLVLLKVLILGHHEYELKCALKGTVHPKMKILSSCTHPQVDPNLYECVCSGRYSEECGKPSSSGSNFLQNIFLSIHIHTGLDLLEDE